MAPHTRPRPSSIDLLPEECEGIVAWAVQELANTPRSQTDVYAEFRTRLIALQGELGLDFDIPHFSSFNRHNLRLAKLTQKMQRSQAIANAVVARTDGADADNLTQASTRMLKTLMVEVMEGAADAGMSFKEAKDAATALRQLALAETASTGRRQKLEAEERARQVEAEMKAKAEAALDMLESEPGVSKAAIKRAKEKFLGVRPPKKKPETEGEHG